MHGLTRSPLFASIASAGALLLAVPAQAVSPPPAQGENGMVGQRPQTGQPGRRGCTETGRQRRGCRRRRGLCAGGHPAQAGNLGGGGFLVIRMADGRETMVDFREAARWPPAPTCTLDKDGNVRKEAVVTVLAGRRRARHRRRAGICARTLWQPAQQIAGDACRGTGARWLCADPVGRRGRARRSADHVRQDGYLRQEVFPERRPPLTAPANASANPPWPRPCKPSPTKGHNRSTAAGSPTKPCVPARRAAASFPRKTSRNTRPWSTSPFTATTGATPWFRPPRPVQAASRCAKA